MLENMLFPNYKNPSGIRHSPKINSSAAISTAGPSTGT